MDKDKKGKPEEKKTEKKKSEDIDEELDQTFPASDPPSYSRPSNEKKASKVKKDDSSD